MFGDYFHMFTSSQCCLIITIRLHVQRLADEKAKKKAASKRQEELEQQQQQKKKMEEEAKRKKIQQAVSQCSDLCRDLPPLAAVCCTHLFPVLYFRKKRSASRS